MGSDCSGYGVSWGDGNVLKLRSGGGRTTVTTLKTTELH